MAHMSLFLLGLPQASPLGGRPQASNYLGGQTSMSTQKKKHLPTSLVELEEMSQRDHMLVPFYQPQARVKPEPAFPESWIRDASFEKSNGIFFENDVPFSSTLRKVGFERVFDEIGRFFELSGSQVKQLREELALQMGMSKASEQASYLLELIAELKAREITLKGFSKVLLRAADELLSLGAPTEEATLPVDNPVAVAGQVILLARKIRKQERMEGVSEKKAERLSRTATEIVAELPEWRKEQLRAKALEDPEAALEEARALLREEEDPVEVDLRRSRLLQMVADPSAEAEKAWMEISKPRIPKDDRRSHFVERTKSVRCQMCATRSRILGCEEDCPQCGRSIHLAPYFGVLDRLLTAHQGSLPGRIEHLREVYRQAKASGKVSQAEPGQAPVMTTELLAELGRGVKYRSGLADLLVRENVRRRRIQGVCGRVMERQLLPLLSSMSSAPPPYVMELILPTGKLHSVPVSLVSKVRAINEKFKALIARGTAVPVPALTPTARYELEEQWHAATFSKHEVGISGFYGLAKRRSDLRRLHWQRRNLSVHNMLKNHVPQSARELLSLAGDPDCSRAMRRWLLKSAAVVRKHLTAIAGARWQSVSDGVTKKIVKAQSAGWFLPLQNRRLKKAMDLLEEGRLSKRRKDVLLCGIRTLTSLPLMPSASVQKAFSKYCKVLRFEEAKKRNTQVLSLKVQKGGGAAAIGRLLKSEADLFNAARKEKDEDGMRMHAAEFDPLFAAHKQLKFADIGLLVENNLPKFLAQFKDRNKERIGAPSQPQAIAQIKRLVSGKFDLETFLKWLYAATGATIPADVQGLESSFCTLKAVVDGTPVTVHVDGHYSKLTETLVSRVLTAIHKPVPGIRVATGRLLSSLLSGTKKKDVVPEVEKPSEVRLNLEELDPPKIEVYKESNPVALPEPCELKSPKGLAKLKNLVLANGDQAIADAMENIAAAMQEDEVDTGCLVAPSADRFVRLVRKCGGADFHSRRGRNHPRVNDVLKNIFTRIAQAMEDDTEKAEEMQIERGKDAPVLPVTSGLSQEEIDGFIDYESDGYVIDVSSKAPVLLSTVPKIFGSQAFSRDPFKRSIPFGQEQPEREVRPASTVWSSGVISDPSHLPAVVVRKKIPRVERIVFQHESGNRRFTGYQRIPERNLQILCEVVKGYQNFPPNLK